MVREATPEELGECGEQCECARCAMGDEAHDAQVAEMMEKYGWYVHFVFDGPTMNAHTHGVLESFSHSDFQIVLPLDSKVAHSVLSRLIDMVKSGTKFEPGEEYQGVIKEGFGVTFVVASETGRLVLRLIICDSNGCLDKDKMDGEYAKQYE